MEEVCVCFTPQMPLGKLRSVVEEEVRSYGS